MTSRLPFIVYLTDSQSICSAFDQMLDEDRKMNRLVSWHPRNLRTGDTCLYYYYQLDSFQLWTYVVSNELLSRTNIILFLNKFDIFKAKIGAGARFADYVTSYRDRPNDIDSTSNCTLYPLSFSHEQSLKSILDRHKEKVRYVVPDIYVV